MRQNGKASTEKKTFSRQTSVTILIDADTKTIWDILTNSKDFPRWNSTIVSLEGKIKKGEKIKLVSTLDPKRTFNLKIKEAIPGQKLVWGDSMGNRNFLLEPTTDGKVNFSMTEKIGGPIFPLFAGMIPSFDEAFEQFAADLKREAERK
ncbi:MAG: SRPBCC domain-containing protein [Bacteroidota bacterium]